MAHQKAGDDEDARRWLELGERWMDSFQPDHPELLHSRAEALAIVAHRQPQRTENREM